MKIKTVFLLAVLVALASAAVVNAGAISYAVAQAICATGCAVTLCGLSGRCRRSVLFGLPSGMRRGLRPSLYRLGRMLRAVPDNLRLCGIGRRL